MEAFFHTILVVSLYILYILLIPVVMIVATPFILILPGKKRDDGTRNKRPIKERYTRIWKVLEGVGVGLPTS